MRPLEILGFLAALFPPLAIIGLLPTSIGILAALASMGILLAAAIGMGAYWQLLPLYAAVFLALWVLLSAPFSRRVRVASAGAVFCLLALSAAFTSILPMFQLPKPTGPYAVGTRIVHLVDPTRTETHISGPPRPRELMVQIWYPASPDGQHRASYRRRKETTWLSSYMDVLWTHSYLNAPVAKSGGPFPVLLFNPAWTGQRTQNTYQTEDLASHGFVVVGIDHTYNSGPVAFPDGRVIGIAGVHDITDFSHTTVPQQIAIGDREVRIEAGDDIQALNYLAAQNLDPHSPWYSRVDANNAGAFGHSFGGAVAAQACYQDPRIHAALNEDGWAFGDVFTHGLDKPYLVMYEDSPSTTTDYSAGDHQAAKAGPSREDELDSIDAANMRRSMQQYGGYFLLIRGTRHNNFRDRSLYSPIRRLTDRGTISPRLAHRIVEQYTLQFFAQYLKGKASPLLAATTSPYKEVQFQNWFAKDALTTGGNNGG